MTQFKILHILYTIIINLTFKKNFTIVAYSKVVYATIF